MTVEVRVGLGVVEAGWWWVVGWMGVDSADEIDVLVGVGVRGVGVGWWRRVGWLGVDCANEIDVLVGVGVVDPGGWGRVHGFGVGGRGERREGEMVEG